MLGVAIVGKRHYRYATAGVENTCHLKIPGIHELDQVFHDDVHAVLMEVALVAEAEEIELQALALYHASARNVADDDVPEVGLTGDGAQCGELRAVEGHDLFIVGVQVLKGLQHLGSVLVVISCPLITQQRYITGIIFIS